MSPSETSNDTEESSRRNIVDLKNPQFGLWETDEALAFIENLRQAEGIARLRKCSCCQVILISFQVHG